MAAEKVEIPPPEVTLEMYNELKISLQDQITENSQNIAKQLQSAGTRFSNIEHQIELLKNAPLTKEGDTIVMQDDEKML